jgi:hypothetical protein
MGINDDWSYIRSALHLAQTGHIAYYGWTSPILGWQLYLGALFIKLFGFSFSVVRFSVLLVAAATVYLLHRILVQCGINEGNATIGTLTFALSPLYLPLAFSFMSDAAGLFSLMLCFYLCLRALQATTNKSAFNWLLFALISNLITGTVRQTSWLGVIVIVPSAFWLLRNRRPSPIKAALLWFATVLLIFACVEWFQHQPYTLQDGSLDYIRNRQPLGEVIKNFVRFGLSTPLLLLPVLLAFLSRSWLQTRKARIASCIACGALVAVILAVIHDYRHGNLLFGLAPFSMNYVTNRGLIDIPAIGTRPVVLGPAVQVILTFLVFAAAFACVACIYGAPARINGSMPSTKDRIASSRDICFLFAPFTIAYCGLLLPRGLGDYLLYDRYVLPLVVVALIAVLRIYQQKVAARLPLRSILCLFLVAAYSVAAMHDLYAMERARLAAIDKLRAAGLPRTSYYGGFEYDGWTQIDTWGFVRAGNLNMPPGIQVPPSWIKGSYPCGYMFGKMFSAIRPNYALSFDPQACQGPSRFAPVQYWTWLPPHTGFIYIQTVNLTAAQTGNSPANERGMSP